VSQPPATDTGANRIINRLARAYTRATIWKWTITLPSGATRTVDLPMDAAVYLEKRGLAIQPA
jgi:hypothetical protein